MLKFCANLNFLFQEVPLLDRFAAAAKAGFKGVEIINPYEAAAADIAARARDAGIAVVLMNVPFGNPGERGTASLAGREADFEVGFAEALKYAEATGCRQIHVMAGLVHQGARRATYVANLKKAARLAAKDGVSVIIEPINRRDIPGFFLNKTHVARGIIHEAAEPNLGLQFDLYHRQIEEGDLSAAIAEYAGIARHYQIANPPDRAEPDDGEINFRALFPQIAATGFTGWIGCEYRPRRGTVEGLSWTKACGVTLG